MNYGNTFVQADINPVTDLFVKASSISVGGNVTIKAGGAYTQSGSDVLAPQGNIAITAQKVDITEARETGSQSTEQKFKQSGLTVAITSPVISALQTAWTNTYKTANTKHHAQ